MSRAASKLFKEMSPQLKYLDYYDLIDLRDLIQAYMEELSQKMIDTEKDKK